MMRSGEGWWFIAMIVMIGHIVDRIAGTWLAFRWGHAEFINYQTAATWGCRRNGEHDGDRRYGGDPSSGVRGISRSAVDSRRSRPQPAKALYQSGRFDARNLRRRHRQGQQADASGQLQD